MKIISGVSAGYLAMATLPAIAEEPVTDIKKSHPSVPASPSAHKTTDPTQETSAIESWEALTSSVLPAVEKPSSWISTQIKERGDALVIGGALAILLKGKELVVSGWNRILRQAPGLRPGIQVFEADQSSRYFFRLGNSDEIGVATIAPDLPAKTGLELTKAFRLRGFNGTRYPFLVPFGSHGEFIRQVINQWSGASWDKQVVASGGVNLPTVDHAVFLLREHRYIPILGKERVPVRQDRLIGLSKSQQQIILEDLRTCVFERSQNGEKLLGQILKLGERRGITAAMHKFTNVLHGPILKEGHKFTEVQRDYQAYLRDESKFRFLQDNHRVRLAHLCTIAIGTRVYDKLLSDGAELRTDRRFKGQPFTHWVRTPYYTPGMKH